ncbi:hypothetical protein FOA43_003825 [Brettanomyces nanus]|uniref:Uncharacterized protein n=1 Tax=Eeniella nana TaxID=13502 RepID=A0A875S571_EENNA|nr:uncharacterized protein FOA43_003825 [Brettanomyces nanus]QPG76436.1 hypothetical protein FOA43_003825 [Brettanomyces nanus]
MSRNKRTYPKGQYAGAKRLKAHAKLLSQGGEEPEEESILKSIKIHPLLRGTNGDGARLPVPSEWKSNQDESKLKNPIKNSKWRSSKGFFINPYIDQNDISKAPVRQKRLMQVNEKGKYVREAQLLREQLEQEQEEEERQNRLKSLHLIPDEKLGEQYYAPTLPPNIEWWDQELMRIKSYDGLGDESNVTYKDISDENNPITIYIQHPVPIPAPWEKSLPQLKPLYLTKEEKKRLRKNARTARIEEKRDRVKLGLDPAPPPKVKLKNLMNVLTNETIKNPTEVEMKIKQEVEQRQIEHEKMNKDRQLTKEQRRDKLQKGVDKDRLKKGYHSCIFRVGRLTNPKHVYKVDINAKEYGLTGLCLNLKDGISLVIVEGGQKAVNKYKKLMLRRIKWQENERPNTEKNNDSLPLEDLSSNDCQLVWEGELPLLHFRKWSMYNYETEDSIVDILGRYKLENYWRQANA